MPYLRVSFSVVKANIEDMEKALPLLVKTFLLFSQKLYLTIKVVLERAKNGKLSGLIPAKRDPSNHYCRFKKSFLGLQYVQEL